MIQVGSSVQSNLGKCNLCKRKILSKACFLKCNICLSNVHIRCLKQVSKKDDLYKKKDCNEWICTLCSSDLFPFNHYEDDLEFLLTISGSSDKYMHLPFNMITNQDIMFQPLDLNEDDGISPL